MAEYYVDKQVISKVIKTPNSFSKVANLIANEASNGWINTACGYYQEDNHVQTKESILTFIKTLDGEMVAERMVNTIGDLRNVCKIIASEQCDFYFTFFLNKSIGDIIKLRCGFILEVCLVDDERVALKIMYSNYTIDIMSHSHYIHNFSEDTLKDGSLMDLYVTKVLCKGKMSDFILALRENV